MKKIIINADDFGLSKSINRGIIKAYEEGVLTSASLMVNMPGFEDAVGLIKENPNLDIGLHLNFFRGSPILPHQKIVSLVDKNGFFLQNFFTIIRRIYTKRIRLLELEEECSAQISKALERDIRITHIDSEKHLHLFGQVYGVIVKLAKKYGINTIRTINEYPYILKFGLKRRNVFNSSLGKVAALQVISLRRKKVNSINSIKTTDYSFGLLDRNGMTLDKYEKLFKYLKDGVTEVFCHPGYIDEEWLSAPLKEQRFRINTVRESELDVLLSPRLKEAIRNLNIQLIDFSKL